MFNLGVRENQYLFIALLGGTAAVFAVYLLYAAFWRTRDDQPAAAAVNVRQGFLAWVFSFIPWILIVLYIAWLAYGLVYMFLTTANPPNW